MITSPVEDHHLRSPYTLTEHAHTHTTDVYLHHLSQSTYNVLQLPTARQLSTTLEITTYRYKYLHITQ